MPETIFDSKDYAALFDWPEYCIFGVVVAMSMGIGIFYGFFDKKNVTNEDFLVGGRSMSILPVTLSLVCSFISGVALLGDPIEVYYYGLRYIFFVLSIIPMIFAVTFLYVPVFCSLNLTSAYQYLEMRFNRTVRRIVSFTAIIHLTLYMALTVWAPSLALDQVAGINKYLSSAVIFLTCIVYSSLGGLKAVLWSDTLQATIMMGSIITILIMGVDEVGGIKEVWDRAKLGGRTELWSFDPDPRTRYTLWTGLFASYFTWLPLFAGTQGQIQRYLAVPSVKKAQQCLLLSLIGLLLVEIPALVLGLVIYAKYHNCDPVSVDAVGSSDQLLPLFVMDALGTKTGLPGLMVAGLTCGSLSTISTALNAIPAIVVEDYVKLMYPNLSSVKLGYLSKIISTVAGLISFGVVFIVAGAGSIIPFSALLHGGLLGPTVGIFSLAFFFPWANSIGAICGATIGISLTFLLGLGSTINGLNGHLPNQKLPLTTDGCYVNSTTSTILDDSVSEASMSSLLQQGRAYDDSWKDDAYPGILNLFSVSYIWQPAVAVLGTVIFGAICSAIVNIFVEPKLPVESKYMSPPVVKLWKKLLSKEKFQSWICEEKS